MFPPIETDQKKAVKTTPLPIVILQNFEGLTSRLRPIKFKLQVFLPQLLLELGKPYEG